MPVSHANVHDDGILMNDFIIIIISTEIFDHYAFDYCIPYGVFDGRLPHTVLSPV